LLFPEFSLVLFPVGSLENLNVLSQIGLILFMFIVGMELDLSVLKNRAKEAIVISQFSIIFPFAIGVCVVVFFIVPSEMNISVLLTRSPSFSQLLITALPALTPLTMRSYCHSPFVSDCGTLPHDKNDNKSITGIILRSSMISASPFKVIEPGFSDRFPAVIDCNIFSFRYYFSYKRYGVVIFNFKF